MFYGGEVLDGTYQIIQEIGKGGTGIVYKGYHLRLKKYVVIKKLKDSMAGREEVRIEVDILKRLHHMYLPQVYDFLETDGQIYTIMDYIDGEDLQQYLDRGENFDEKTLITWMKQLCDVLEYLHGQHPPILHSDIKPGNIMVTGDGNICLIDFNISLGGEHGGDIVGLSQWYAAPEQYEKAQLRMAHLDSSGIMLDGRMDIYSLGASFYSLMTGQVPDITSPDFLPLSRWMLPYSSAFVNIVEKCMELLPGRRYQDAAALRKALDYMYRMDEGYRRMQRQGWLLCGVCGACVVSGILSCVYGWQNMSREAYEKDYRTFYESAQEYEGEDTIALGMELLNEQRYREILEKNPEDKAEILYSIGNAYFGQDDYDTAAEYYQDAAAENPISVYYRDQVVAEIKAGSLSKAQETLRKAEKAGVHDEELTLAEQETAFAQGDAKRVIEIAQTLKDSSSREISGYSSLLAAKAYETLGMYEEQAQYLETAYLLGEDKRCLRELGSTYLDAAENSQKTQKTAYLQRAMECYEKLQKFYAVSYRDQMNLAVIQEMLGEYRESEKLLKELKKQYPEEYEVYMHLAYVCLKQQESLKEDARDYSQASEYYRKAKQRYLKAGSPADTAMSELSEYMEQMEGGR